MSRWSRRRRTRFSTKPLRQSRRLSRDLYTFFRSSTSYRLRIALAYKRLEYTPHYVSLPKMEHRTPSYRALHAQGLVPLLIDGDQSFIQSMAIIEYLDEVYPEPPLMPGDVHGRHYVRAVSQIIGCDIHPLNNVRVLKHIQTQFGADEAATKSGIAIGSPRGWKVWRLTSPARASLVASAMAIPSPWRTSVSCRRFSMPSASIVRSTTTAP